MIVITKQIPCPKRSYFTYYSTLSLSYETAHKIFIFLSVLLKSINHHLL